MPKEAITRPICTGILLTGIILAVGETDNKVYIFNDTFNKKDITNIIQTATKETADHGKEIIWGS